MSGTELVPVPPPPAGEKRKTGRPKGVGLLYTPELGQFICEMIAEGYTLKQICEPADMPHPLTVSGWRDTFPDFGRLLARARAIQLEAWSQEARDIANTVVMGEEFVQVVEEGEFGGTSSAKRVTRRERRDMLGRARLQSEVLIRLIASVQQAEQLHARNRALEGTGEDAGKITIEGGLPDDQD